MLLSKRILDRLSILILSAVLLFSPAPAFSLQPMTEGEMDLITGQRGFSEVKIENDTAKVWLNIDVETHARIGTFKANYDPDNNPAADPALEPDRDWDQAWYDVYLGEYDASDNPVSTNPLVLQGFILEAAFDDITNTNRRLVSLKVGFDIVNGEISADFASFSGFGNSPREAYYRDSLGQGTFTFTDDPIHMIMHSNGYGETNPAYRPGIYMDFGDAQFN